MQTESYTNNANIVSDSMNATKTINIIAVPGVEKSERLLEILRGMNLALDVINPTVLNNFTCLPTYAILFILYDFSIRQHTAENVSNHLQSSINFIVSESQIPSNLKLPYYETQQQQQQYVRDPRVIQPPYSMPMESISSYAIPPLPPSQQQSLSYDYYSSSSSSYPYDNNNHIYSIPPPPSSLSSSNPSSTSSSPFHQHIIPPHPLPPSQSHNKNSNSSIPSSASSSTSSLSSLSSSSHSIYNSNSNNNNGLKGNNNDDFRSRSRSPPRHPTSPVHLPYELDVYYRDLIRTGKIPEGALDHRSLKAVEDLGVSKGKDALRALSETNIYAIRNFLFHEDSAKV